MPTPTFDLCAVAADGRRDGVWADRGVIVRALGEPLQIEDFDGHDTVFFILADGTDGKLTVTDVGAHGALQPGRIGPSMIRTASWPASPSWAASRMGRPGRAAPTSVEWFWHDMARFHRGPRPRAAVVGGGQLDALRGYCVNLARLRADFSGHVGRVRQAGYRRAGSRSCPAGLHVRRARPRSDAGSPREPWPTTTGRWFPTSRPRTASHIPPSWRP